MKVAAEAIAYTSAGGAEISLIRRMALAAGGAARSIHASLLCAAVEAFATVILVSV